MEELNRRGAVDVVAALIEDGLRFLICRRPTHKARGALWELAGGKVEPGETASQALVRECREELGVTLEVGPLRTRLTHAYPDVTICLAVYSARIAAGTPQLLEHSALQWITAEERGSYPLSPADRIALDRIFQGGSPC